MRIEFDRNAIPDTTLEESVREFLSRIPTLEAEHNTPIIVFQDGVNGSYYIKCSLIAEDAVRLCDLDARLTVDSEDTYRTNRQLLLENQTYIKMVSDAENGREFNDIIVEYNTGYSSDQPLKVWGGQHRISAISQAGSRNGRYHGFRIYFNLSKDQRTEVALISNTNIAVSNDTFDRMIEETKLGDALRKWCQKAGLLAEGEDFPDMAAGSDKITVKLARSFIVNFYRGRERGQQLTSVDLDHNVYEPYLAETGAILDSTYSELMETYDILNDEVLIEAGREFAALHKAQYTAVMSKRAGIPRRKSFRNKALIESVLCGWSYIAGLLQSYPDRLKNHYKLPETKGKVKDPMNAVEMSKFKHDFDPATYRGLGTRSLLKDRQRIAQLFLAKSLSDSVVIDKRFMNRAVSQVVSTLAMR